MWLRCLHFTIFGHSFIDTSFLYFETMSLYKIRMEKLQSKIYWAIIASETSHVFCCVLPTLFSVVSLFAGVGLIGTMPGWLESVHAALHSWEIPIIVMSGVVLALGWALDVYGRKVDCHETGCHHGPCDTRKKRAHMILKAATLLFIVNVTVYVVFHRGLS